MSNKKTGWGEPPAKTKPGPKDTWTLELKAQPGRWGWREYAHKSSASGMRKYLTDLGFEATTRDRRCYARWPAPVVDHQAPLIEATP